MTQRRMIWPWIALPIAALLLAVRLFVVGFYKIPSGAMIPTLKIGDHIFINQLARDPKRGDVIVFKFPKEPDKDFVKRVVGVGGDKVEIRDGALYLNGSPIQHVPRDRPTDYDDYDESTGGWSNHRCRAFEERLDGASYTIIHTDDQKRSFGPFDVPPGSYFVMGDNRDNSHDSRYWGFVPKDHVRGTLWRVWYSGGR